MGARPTPAFAGSDWPFTYAAKIPSVQAICPIGIKVLNIGHARIRLYSQRMCNNLMNEFTGERCALEEGHAGRCRSKEVSMVPESIKPVRTSWTVYRSAITGRYVTRLFAQLYPDTTVEERRTQ